MVFLSLRNGSEKWFVSLRNARFLFSFNIKIGQGQQRESKQPFQLSSVQFRGGEGPASPLWEPQNLICRGR